MTPAPTIAGILALMMVLAAASGIPPLEAATGVRIETLHGRQLDPLKLPAGVRAAVYLFVSVECPISNRYAPEMQRLYARFAGAGVQFATVYPNPAERADAIAEHRHAYGYPGEALRDPGHSLVAYSGITITPEVAVFTADGALAYRGRIDNRYVNLGVERPAPTRHDLADALTNVLAEARVREPRTQAVGCYVADFAR